MKLLHIILAIAQAGSYLHCDLHSNKWIVWIHLNVCDCRSIVTGKRTSGPYIFWGKTVSEETISQFVMCQPAEFSLNGNSNYNQLTRSTLPTTRQLLDIGYR